jgi:endonuclease III
MNFQRQFRNLFLMPITPEIAENMSRKIDNLDIFLDYINDPNVVGEVTLFRAARRHNPRLHARNVIIFSMLSPQTRFDANVEAYKKLVPQWDLDLEQDEIVDLIRDVQFSRNKAKYLFEAKEFLNDPYLHEKMTRTNIHNLKGMGDKTTAFALALYDDMMPVFTMDLHILRALAFATGYGANVNVPPPRTRVYNQLEQAILEWTRSRGIESPFVAQWSLWNAWQNRHISHLPIIQV